MTRTRQILLTSLMLVVTYCFGSDAILKRNGTLRSDPSSTNPPVLILKANEDVELLSATPNHGYYHAHTGEGKEGWVFGCNLQMVSDDAAPSAGAPVPTSPANVGSAAVSADIPNNWDKPDPNQTHYEGVDSSCGPTGDGGTQRRTHARTGRMCQLLIIQCPGRRSNRYSIRGLGVRLISGPLSNSS